MVQGIRKKDFDFIISNYVPKKKYLTIKDLYIIISQNYKFTDYDLKTKKGSKEWKIRLSAYLRIKRKEHLVLYNADTKMYYFIENKPKEYNADYKSMRKFFEKNFPRDRYLCYDEIRALIMSRYELQNVDWGTWKKKNGYDLIKWWEVMYYTVYALKREGVMIYDRDSHTYMLK